MFDDADAQYKTVIFGETPDNHTPIFQARFVYKITPQPNLPHLGEARSVGGTLP